MMSMMILRIYWMKSILVCDELGASRDYITLVKISRTILQIAISEGHDQNENKYTNSIVERFKKEIETNQQKNTITTIF